MSQETSMTELKTCPHDFVEEYSLYSTLYVNRYRLGEKKLHRLDEPAVNFVNGHQIYYNNDMCHREDGPASVGNDFEGWFIKGKAHRLDGPAMTYKDGTQYWYKEGNLHRLDGPAVINGSGVVEYWINGQYHTKEEFDLEVNWRQNEPSSLREN